MRVSEWGRVRTGSAVVDYRYLAMATQHEPAGPAELRFGWRTAEELDQLGMFDDSRRGAHLLLDGSPTPRNGARPTVKPGVARATSLERTPP